MARKIAHHLCGVALMLAISAVSTEALLRLLTPDTGDDWTGGIHRASRTPGLSYELAPGVDGWVERVGQVVKTNSFGMRDAEPRKDAGFRVACVGDSFTFGFGAPVEATYPDVIESLIDGEVLNLGVSGYSTRDEAAVVELRALEWDPDLIVIGYVLNDPEISPVQPLHHHFQPIRSELLRRLRIARRQWRQSQRGVSDYYEYLHLDGEAEWESVPNAFQRIAKATAKGPRVLVAIFPLTPEESWESYRYQPLHQKVAKAAREAGLEVEDLLPAFEKHPAAELRLSKHDHHPSVLGHRVAAEAIAARIQPELVASSVVDGR